MNSSNGSVEGIGLCQELFSRGIRLPFDTDLHEYQKEDIRNYGWREKSGYFLDIGLGKTVVGAITAGYNLLDKFDRAFVLCPATLIDQWYDVLLKMNFKVQKYVGSPTVRARASFDFDFSIMSFEIFQKDYRKFKDLDKTFFLVDEATILSNTKNKIWKMINGGVIKKKKKIPGKIKPDISAESFPYINNGCCLLTATPSNNPSDLYGIIKTIDPIIYVDEFQFNALHVSERDYFDQPKDFCNLDLLKSNLRAVGPVRFATDHLDLPEKVYNVIEYNLPPEHYELYCQLLEERLITYKNNIVINAIEATSLYNWAQKIVVNPDKAMYPDEPVVMGYVDTIVRNNPQTLLVNKYVMTNQKMMEKFKDIGIGGCFGGISRAKQKAYIKDFTAGKLRVLTVNPKSGGIGLNLQCCSNVVFPEVPVTARDFRQAEGRVYRQGQVNRVIVTVLIARKTIQQTLLRNIMEKDEVNNEVLCNPITLRKDLFPSE